jgi:hypothetical protein
VYVLTELRPGDYQITIEKDGFRKVQLTGLTLEVQDAVSRNFKLQVGSISESVVVAAGSEELSYSPAVGTVVDHQFVQNTPLNGRSFQPLIALTPGVVFTSQNLGPGQFSVNGQRSDTNYFTVDGVSANFGATTGGLGQALGGAIPGYTAQGGTNGLVSVDAMQEFRIETSSYAPELGRTPGAQISIVTKSGSNEFHGTVYDYLRNDVFDARNYFDAPPLPKPPLRQNDFGGTLSGPIRKDRTFFFFSYEGLRLDLPQTASGDFFTASARTAVAPAYQPIVKALPLPAPSAPLVDPTCDNITNPCFANLSVAYSDPSSLTATSIRIDHSLSKKINLFARCDHAPSYSATRYWEELDKNNANTDTLTLGATLLVASTQVNEFRVNWSRNTSTVVNSLTDFHGAKAPPASVLYPSAAGYSPDKGQALISFSDESMEVRAGTNYSDVQRQFNLVDTYSWAVGVHQFKFGVDYRRLHPTSLESTGYAVFPAYTDLVAGTAGEVLLQSDRPFSVKVNNYSLFAQDTWKITRRLTLTYGLRWEINTPPISATSGEPLYVLQGIFDSKSPAEVPGSLWHTRYNNFAPRIGAAYQVTPKTVVRGSFGVFYDLGYGNVGDEAFGFPYERYNFISAPPPLAFNLLDPAFQPLSFSTVIDANQLSLRAVDPDLRLPYTLQWNASVQRELGTIQTLTASYVGSNGRDLLREDVIYPLELVSLGDASVRGVRNAGFSHYDALQVQFQRRMLRGLQALVSYSLAKSSDQGSSVSSGLAAPSVSEVVLLPLTPSDFDIRNSFATAFSYQVPTPAWGRAGEAILGGWAVDGIVRASSAPPINVTVRGVSPVLGLYTTQAEIVSGQPYWIPDPTQPSGTALNSAAFTTPPTGQTGDFPRNGLRSPYSIDQTDLALRRQFSLTERVKLDMRVEYFNAFNHPMFGIAGSNCNPRSFWGSQGGPPSSGFGKVCPGASTTNIDGGGFPNGQNALYAVGGPRSGQFTLKLHF